MNSTEHPHTSSEVSKDIKIKLNNSDTAPLAVVTDAKQSSDILESNSSGNPIVISDSNLPINEPSTVLIDDKLQLSNTTIDGGNGPYVNNLHRTPWDASDSSSVLSLSSKSSQRSQVVATLSNIKPNMTRLLKSSRRARVRGKRNMVNGIKDASLNIMDTVQTKNSTSKKNTDLYDSLQSDSNLSTNCSLSPKTPSNDYNLGLRQVDIICSSDEVTDFLLENQRGWSIIGQPYYSSNTLIQHFDPPPWTIGNGLDYNDSKFEKNNTKRSRGFETAPGGIYDYPLPDPTWEWKWNTWYVDMSGDVDDNGWSYSFRFGSNTWHGTNIWFHSWVRRRKWKRVRWRKPFISKLKTKKKDGHSTGEPTISDFSSNNTEEMSPTIIIRKLLKDLDACRIDREKTNLIIELVILEDIFSLALKQIIGHHELENILKKFDFRNSKIHLKNSLLELADNYGSNIPTNQPFDGEVDQMNSSLTTSFGKTRTQILSPSHKSKIKLFADAIEESIMSKAFYSDGAQNN